LSGFIPRVGRAWQPTFPLATQGILMKATNWKSGFFVALLVGVLALSGCGDHSAANQEGAKAIADISMADARVGTLVGKKDAQGALVSQRVAGVLMYGPYLSIAPGKYRVVVRGTCQAPDGAGLTLDVVHNKAAITLARKMVGTVEDATKGVLTTLDFEAPHGAADLEIRAVVSADATAAITGYSLYKLQ
jgi:hypothetical protein